MILEFLRDGFLLGLAVSILCSQWAAIRGSALLSFESLASRLLRSFYLKRPMVFSPVPPWDLPLVLNALQRPLFEPLSTVLLQFLTLKVCFWAVITSGRLRERLGHWFLTLSI